MKTPPVEFVRTIHPDDHHNYVHLLEHMQVSSPESYIAELLKYHPEADYNEALGSIRIHSTILNTVFRYIKPEEGCHIFQYDSYSPVDIHYQYTVNPVADFYSIALYFTEERSKQPFYFNTATESHATDNIGLFFNRLFEADLYVKAHQKAFGIRVEMDRKWLKSIINEDILPQSGINAVLKQEQEAFFLLDVAQYRPIVQEIKECLENSGDALRTLHIKMLNAKLVHTFFSDLSKQEPGAVCDQVTSGGELERALLLVNEHITGDFPGIKQLAEACNLSPRTFINRFKSVFHTSPHNYYKKAKMEYACTELKRGIPVKSVAHRAGYKNTTSFCRAFKQVYGKSPVAYRKKE